MTRYLETGIMKMAESKIGTAVVIKRYFGAEGRTNMQFLAELKELSEDERNYLATGAAKELGIPAEQVSFPWVE